MIVLLLLGGCTAPAPPPTEQTPSPSPSAEPVYYEVTSFETKVIDKTSDRVTNLKVCAAALDGVIVNPGEAFSFNETVGKRTSEKGYEEARILIGDEAGCAVGGGVCQISSTLFNAVDAAGLKVTERHNHQNDVHYVDIGRDAAVSYGTLDFKFTNSSAKPIKISLKASETAVRAAIMMP